MLYMCCISLNIKYVKSYLEFEWSSESEYSLLEKGSG